MEKNDYKKIVASCFCSMMLVSSAWAQESDYAQSLYKANLQYVDRCRPIKQYVL